jgi:hypothetical protein
MIQSVATRFDQGLIINQCASNLSATIHAIGITDDR